MKVGQYCIKAHRGQWLILQCYCLTSTRQAFAPVPGERAYSYSDREAALRRSYELNGWKWPPKPRPR